MHPQQAQLTHGIGVIGEGGDRLDRRRSIVADKDHVAARRTGRAGPVAPTTAGVGRLHVEIVAEHDALKAQAPAQDLSQPKGREARRLGGDTRIEHMGRHHGLQTLADE
jgi:hypothetical protein